MTKICFVCCTGSLRQTKLVYVAQKMEKYVFFLDKKKIQKGQKLPTRHKKCQKEPQVTKNAACLDLFLASFFKTYTILLCHSD